MGRSASTDALPPPNSRGDLPKKLGDFPSIRGDLILLAARGGKCRSSSPELESLADADDSSRSSSSSALPFEVPPSSAVRGSAPDSKRGCLSFFPASGVSSCVKEALVSLDDRPLGASGCVSTLVPSDSGLLASGRTRIGGEPGLVGARCIGGVRPMDPYPAEAGVSGGTDKRGVPSEGRRRHFDLALSSCCRGKAEGPVSLSSSSSSSSSSGDGGGFLAFPFSAVSSGSSPVRPSSCSATGATPLICRLWIALMHFFSFR